MPRYKLDGPTVEAIKKLLSKRMSQGSIARQFKVSQASISNISNGTQWGEIPWPNGHTGGIPEEYTKTKIDVESATASLEATSPDEPYQEDKGRPRIRAKKSKFVIYMETRAALREIMQNYITHMKELLDPQEYEAFLEDLHTDPMHGYNYLLQNIITPSDEDPVVSHDTTLFKHLDWSTPDLIAYTNWDTPEMRIPTHQEYHLKSLEKFISVPLILWEDNLKAKKAYEEKMEKIRTGKTPRPIPNTNVLAQVREKDK